MKTPSLTMIVIVAAIAVIGTWKIVDDQKKKAAAPVIQGKALYEEKCRTVAGEKIYKKVEGVEGLVLLKVRPDASDREWADRNWPGAAFALEAREEEYITTFLGYEVGPGDPQTTKPMPITPERRGYIVVTDREGALPGYRYVDVIDEKDGKRYRYTGRLDEPWRYDSSYSKTYKRFVLDRMPAPDPSPRYGVTFEDHVNPEERKLWVASSTVKVIDLQTKEVLGEMTRYAWAGGGPTPASPSPWLRARKCPSQAYGSDAATRKFVDQILIPKKDK